MIERYFSQAKVLIRLTRTFNPFLKAVDHEIRDNHGQGDVIYLRGANLGGWLLFEGWQTPMDASENLKDDWSGTRRSRHSFLGLKRVIL